MRAMWSVREGTAPASALLLLTMTMCITSSSECLLHKFVQNFICFFILYVRTHVLWYMSVRRSEANVSKVPLPAEPFCLSSSWNF